jgi:hypothetical protein
MSQKLYEILIFGAQRKHPTAHHEAITRSRQQCLLSTKYCYRYYFNSLTFNCSVTVLRVQVISLY